MINQTFKLIKTSINEKIKVEKKAMIIKNDDEFNNDFDFYVKLITIKINKINK